MKANAVPKYIFAALFVMLTLVFTLKPSFSAVYQQNYDIGRLITVYEDSPDSYQQALQQAISDMVTQQTRALQEDVNRLRQAAKLAENYGLEADVKVQIQAGGFAFNIPAADLIEWDGQDTSKLGWELEFAQGPKGSERKASLKHDPKKGYTIKASQQKGPAQEFHVEFSAPLDLSDTSGYNAKAGYKQSFGPLSQDVTLQTRRADEFLEEEDRTESPLRNSLEDLIAAMNVTWTFEQKYEYKEKIDEGIYIVTEIKYEVSISTDDLRVRVAEWILAEELQAVERELAEANHRYELIRQRVAAVAQSLGIETEGKSIAQLREASRERLIIIARDLGVKNPEDMSFNELLKEVYSQGSKSPSELTTEADQQKQPYEIIETDSGVVLPGSHSTKNDIDSQKETHGTLPTIEKDLYYIDPELFKIDPRLFRTR